MTTFNASAVSDTAIGFEKPITLQQGRALRDNPIAISEGSTGAHKIQGRALGNFWPLFSSAGAGVGLTDLDRMTNFRVDVALGAGVTSSTVQIRLSNDNGATFGSWQTMITPTVVSGTLDAMGFLRFNIVTGAYLAAMSTADGPQISSATLTVPASANAFELRAVSATAYLDVYSFGGLA